LARLRILSNVAGKRNRSRKRKGRRGEDELPSRGLSADYGSSVLAPLRVRSFRIQWPSDLLTSCAFEMETLILGWYVLAETGSVLLLSVFGALLFTGTLIAPMFGVVGDRIGHRNLLCAMRALYTVLATTLMAIAWAGALTPLIVFVISGLMGLVRPSDLGVRGALVAHIVPAEQLVSAMGISRTTSDAARVMGALTGASLFAGFGIAAAYVVVASFYAVGLLLVLAMSTGEIKRALPAADAGTPRPSHWRDLRDGLAFVWSSPPLLAGVWLAVLVNATAFPLSGQLLPYVAREVYHVDQTGLGHLAASFAAGALLGSVAVSMHRTMQPARVMLLTTFVWYALLLVFAQMETLAGGAPMLALAGFAQSFCMISCAVVLLRLAGERFRGRIMGMRMMAIYGMPVGLLAAGVLIERIGFAATATLYALLGLAFTLIIAAYWRAQLWGAHLPANAR
jgi:MFS family permease